MPWYENDDGIRFWYEDQGQGPTILLLHGWCMSSAVWRFQFEALSSFFRVIAPDLRGHGRSQSAEGCDFTGFTGDIIALFGHLGLTDVLLAGWSLGAQVALQLLPQVRERLAGLALIAGTPRFISSDDFPYAVGRIEAEGMGIKIHRNIVRAVKGFTGNMFTTGELDDPVLAIKIREVLAAVPVPETAVALQGLNALMEADMRALLSLVDLPALVINGDRDVICLPEASAYTASQISSCRQIVFSGCGHAPFLTFSQEFNACLIDFSRRIRERSN